MSSDIAMLRQRIQTECEAMKQALFGYATVARHEIITHRFRALGQHQEQLARSIGPEEAQRIIFETYSQILGAPDG